MKSLLKKLWSFIRGEKKPPQRVIPVDPAIFKELDYKIHVTPPIKVRKPKPKPLPLCLSKNKVSFTEEKAKARAEQLTRAGQKMRAYRCMFCPYWHLTHKKNKLNLH